MGFFQKYFRPKSESKSTNSLAAQVKIKDGRFLVNIRCACGQEGEFSHKRKDFQLLGKDKEGFLYFECPGCSRHLKLDPTNNYIELA